MEQRQATTTATEVSIWVRKMAAHYGIDLDEAIEAKLEYNRGPTGTGGKAL